MYPSAKHTDLYPSDPSAASAVRSGDDTQFTHTKVGTVILGGVDTRSHFR